MSDELELEHDDDGAGDAETERLAKVTCEVCGHVAKTPMSLGLHRRNAHGIAGQSDPRKRGSGRRASTAGTPRRGGRSETKHNARKRAIRETLTEFVNFTDELAGVETDTPHDLRAVVRRDADKIGDSLAYLAERLAPVAWAVDKLLGHGGPVTMLRGFLGVGTWSVRRWREMLSDRELELEARRVQEEHEAAVAAAHAEPALRPVEPAYPGDAAA